MCLRKEEEGKEIRVRWRKEKKGRKEERHLPAQEDTNTLLDLGILALDAKFGKGSDGGGTNNGIFKDNTVVNMTNVDSGVWEGGALCAKEVKDPGSKFRVLAIFDELAQLDEGRGHGLGDGGGDIEDGVDNGTFVLVASLLPKDTGEEGEHNTLLGGEFEAKGPDGRDDDDLELITNLTHETGDLFHETINTCLITRLEKGGDGEGGDTTVPIGDETLHLQITGLDCSGDSLGQAIQGTNGSEAQSSFRGGEEELKDIDGRVKFPGGGGGHGADELGGLVADNVRTMPEVAFEELVELSMLAMGRGGRGKEKEG